MIEKYCGGEVPAATTRDEIDDELISLATGVASKVEERMNEFQFNLALEEIWTLIRRANKYIDEKTPWILAKDEAKKDELDTVMNHLAETLRIVSILIYPFMHTTSEKIRKQLGIEGDIIWEDSEVFNMMNGEQVKKGEQIFPRLDVEKELTELTKIAEEEAAKKAAGAVQDPVEKAIAESVPLKLKDEIVYGDFDKMDFRVGTILKAEKHPNADKLLVFQVKMGTEVRQVISGVADSFTPEEMVGKKVVVVANLKPRMLRGLESHGMLLFAGDDGRNFVVTTDAPDGEIVS
jgi:methionyl-tRNA synthetase